MDGPFGASGLPHKPQRTFTIGWKSFGRWCAEAPSPCRSILRLKPARESGRTKSKAPSHPTYRVFGETLYNIVDGPRNNFLRVNWGLRYAF